MSTLDLFLPFYDTISSKSAVTPRNLMYNNLIWPDPYNPAVLVGDAADRWEIGADGKVITFFLNKGIQFHDGVSLTSKDVAYNIDRAWKPRTPTMTEFRGRLEVLAKIETPDDASVRLTLASPSNYLLQALGNSQFLIYPAQWPIEDDQKFDAYKKNPIGTGPFKFLRQDPGTKLELVRNQNYWKPGLPYLDGVVMNVISPDGVLAAFRTGRLDSVNIDHAYIVPNIQILERETGFVKYPMIAGPDGAVLNQRPPFGDARVREALSLALDRHSFLQIMALGNGTALASPMPPPEIGGKWGIPANQMETRPGYRKEKADDLARAKRLLADAGVDPAKTTIHILASTGIPDAHPLAFESAARTLGFKTQVEALTSVALAQRVAAGDFDIDVIPLSPQTDDPLDFLPQAVRTGGVQNFGKWSNPRLDALFDEQDRTLDQVKRQPLVRELQEVIMTDNTFIFGIWRGTYKGHQPWVKNYPGKAPFTFSGKFRWEQVWLDR